MKKWDGKITGMYLHFYYCFHTKTDEIGNPQGKCTTGSSGRGLYNSQLFCLLA